MTKVLVAMSGGVDSSVAAALLVAEGYSVAGGYMKNFSRESWEGVIDDNCPWKEDVRDVKKVCKKLDIKFYSFNFEKEYRKKVIENFFTEYAAGRTPNPDVLCNKEIKFDLFLKEAKNLGFDYIATGHYARLRREIPNSKSKIPIYKLLKAHDQNKDQSYFLYRLNQYQLRHTLFPLANLTKPQVRKLARKFGLPNAEKKDSQGVCFIGHINLPAFLKQRIPSHRGTIKDTNGHVIGAHSGAAYFTIGQRHGLDIQMGHGPYFVVKKDVRTNTLFVTSNPRENALNRKILRIKGLSWIGEIPKTPFSCQAKIRYRQRDQKCLVKKDTKGTFVAFEKPQFAPAPGQSVVFYKNDIVLGGGIIK